MSCMRGPGMMQAGERRQLRHQEPDKGLQSVLPRCAPPARADSRSHMECPMRYNIGSIAPWSCLRVPAGHVEMCQMLQL